MIAAAEYGRAMYSLAKADHAEHAVLETLTGIDQILTKNPGYTKLLDTPAIPTDEKCGLIDNAFGECEQIVLNFLKILCEKHAVYQLHACVKAYNKLYNEEHGIAEATCITARPLGEEQRAALCGKLSEMTKKTIRLTEKVDAALIGGIVLLVDGKQLDGSIRTRLDGFRQALAETIV